MVSMTPSEIIEALGDTGVVAAKLGVSLSVVSMMKVRGLPKARLLDLHVLAEELGIENVVTVEVLKQAAKRAPPLAAEAAD